MQLINPILSKDVLTNEGYNDLLDSIDRTIAKIAMGQYKNDVYGFTENIDYNLYDRLCEYREILIDLFMGCNCLGQEYVIYIISKVQKLVC